MDILVACEWSGEVSSAFQALGHRVVSCDLLPSEGTAPHYQGNVLELLDRGWDMMIAFPPCTYLCCSGSRWWASRGREQDEAVAFVKTLLRAPIPRIAIENPVGLLSTVIRKPDQIIQPWQFGHGETKATCLWLKNLSLLVPTHVVPGRTPAVHRMVPGPERSKDRGRTYRGIAQAMASQWSQESI